MDARASWRACFALAVAVGALGAAGCTVDTVDTPPPPVVAPGTLALRWTVNATTDPNACTLGGAAVLDVVITTVGGQFVGEFQAPCGAFATTISSLLPGSYAGSAHMIDSAGNPRTTMLDIDTFSILSDSTLILDLDFPADSFL